MGYDRKVSVEDRIEITELFARYCWGLNTGDSDAVIACFADGGYLDHMPEGRFYGQDIRTLLYDLWYKNPGTYAGRQHLANHFVMTRQGEDVHVKAYCTLVQYSIPHKNNFVFGLCNWNNVITKQNGEWLFKSVVVEKWIGDGVPWIDDRAAHGFPS